ncbi:amino acid transporter [Cystoisospora suis]|uniref:Amino acid transporter n=1 Tax=Cystoisospora suis TaxID=483139 RepID=A0A2C6KDD7_9APIC|nr:amino acid transporter [Cystoisospora suis]
MTLLRRFFWWLRGLLPRSDLPGARQPTPLDLNRYVILFFYVVCGCTTGAVFFGWPAMASLIFRNEGFSTLCYRRRDTGQFEPDLRKEGHLYICDSQDAAVQKLYTVAGALCCVMSACGGALLDWIGPKWTACLGQTLSLSGWLLLAFSGSGRASYYGGIALIGLGADAGFLPTMCATRLFPGSAGLIITVLGAASSASSAVPLVLDTVARAHDSSLRTVSLWYCGCGPGLSIIIALLLLPRRNYVVGGDGDTHAPDKRQGSCERVNTASNTLVSGKRPGEEEDEEGLFVISVPYGQDGVTKEGYPKSSKEKEKTWVSEEVHNSAADGSFSTTGDEMCQETGVSDVFKTEYMNSRSPRSSDAAETRQSQGDELTCVGKLQAEDGMERPSPSGSEPSTSFSTQLFSERYLLVVVYYVGVAWAGAFYQQAPRRMFNDRVVDCMEILQPLGFIPCIILGKLADIFGILRIVAFVNTCGLLMYLSSIVKSDAAGYVSVLLYCFYMSLFTSQVFVYIEETFSPAYFGKLIGLTAMCGGVLSLVCNPLYEYVVVRASKGNPLPMQIALSVLLVLQYIWIGRLMYLKRKCPWPYRSAPVAVHPPFVSPPSRGLSSQVGQSEGRGAEI